MNMIQIGIIGVAGTLLAVQFKSGKSEYGIYISVALSLVIFFAIIGRLEVIIDALRTIANYINMDTAYIFPESKQSAGYKRVELRPWTENDIEYALREKQSAVILGRYFSDSE